MTVDKYKSFLMSPLKADIGWNTKSSLDAITAQTNDTVQSVDDFKVLFREPFKSAAFSYRLAQSRQTAYNSNKYTSPKDKVDNSGYFTKKLFTESISAARSSKTFTGRCIGPFKVTNITSKNVIRLYLLDELYFHPVTHVEHTARTYRQPSDISTFSTHLAQPFIDEHGESVIEVSKILSHRKRGTSWHILRHYKDATLKTHLFPFAAQIQIYWKPACSRLRASPNSQAYDICRHAFSISWARMRSC